MSTNTNSNNTNTTKMKPPLTFLIAIFPGFQLMDVAGPLDILNILSLPPFNIPLRMKFIAETLDPVAVKPISNDKWTYNITSAMGQDEVNTSFNQHFIPDITFESYLASLSMSADNKPDVLFIPGGIGTRLHRFPASSSTSTDASPVNPMSTSNDTLAIKPLLDFIPSILPHLSTGIMTVCTGSDALAYTGLLDSRRATTNMMRFEDVKARHTQVNWQRGARWVRSLPSEVTSSSGSTKGIEIWTSAGISAGMDVTLAFIAEYFGGRDVSADIAKRLEYDWREIGEGERDKLYEKFYTF